jgi:hypothetical protein
MLLDSAGQYRELTREAKREGDLQNAFGSLGDNQRETYVVDVIGRFVKNCVSEFIVLSIGPQA